MQTSDRQDNQMMKKGFNWLMVFGILLMILGVLAVTFSVFTTLLTVVTLGFVIFLGGVILLLDSFKYRPQWMSLLGHAAIGILYLIVGLMLMCYPLTGSITLTLVLGVFYLIVGVFRLFYSFMRFTGWNLLSALISLFLGVLILASWPTSSLFVIGLFVGIDLIFTGWTLFTLAMLNKAVMKTI